MLFFLHFELIPFLWTVLEYCQGMGLKNAKSGKIFTLVHVNSCCVPCWEGLCLPDQLTDSYGDFL